MLARSGEGEQPIMSYARHNQRHARLRQPRADIPRPVVRVLAVWRWAGITVARIAWPDGYVNEVEADLLAPL